MLNRGLAEAQRALDEFKVRYDAIAAQITGDGQEKTGKSTMLLKAAILKKSQLSKEVDEITKQIEEYKANATSLVDYHLIGTGIIYSGTKLVIGPHTMNVHTDYSNSKFYAGQDGIVFGPVLPSDIV